MIAILQPPPCTFASLREATQWVRDQLPADADARVVGTVAGDMIAVQLERRYAERRQVVRS